MVNNIDNKLMREYTRSKKMPAEKWRGFIGRSLLALCLLLVLCAAGCSGEMQAPALQVHLSTPEISGKAVSVNGGVPVPLKRIQWDWGDEKVDKHLFFPASHTYKNPGSYSITVTVFGNNNASVSKSVSVEIK